MFLIDDDSMGDNYVRVFHLCHDDCFQKEFLFVTRGFFDHLHCHLHLSTIFPDDSLVCYPKLALPKLTTRSITSHKYVLMS